ncbi:hypothetical protein IWZ03DRAFT_390358, partial [Phyllosticta citriasiana]
MHDPRQRVRGRLDGARFGACNAALRVQTIRCNDAEVPEMRRQLCHFLHHGRLVVFCGRRLVQCRLAQRVVRGGQRRLRRELRIEGLAVRFGCVKGALQHARRSGIVAFAVFEWQSADVGFERAEQRVERLFELREAWLVEGVRVGLQQRRKLAVALVLRLGVVVGRRGSRGRPKALRCRRQHGSPERHVEGVERLVIVVPVVHGGNHGVDAAVVAILLQGARRMLQLPRTDL